MANIQCQLHFYIWMDVFLQQRQEKNADIYVRFLPTYVQLSML